jgi:hypothetical protein
MVVVSTTRIMVLTGRVARERASPRATTGIVAFPLTTDFTAEVKPRVAALIRIVPGRGGEIKRCVVTGLCGATTGVERSCLCVDGPIMWVCCTSRFSIAE